jgi:hypothetical protein
MSDACGFSVGVTKSEVQIHATAMLFYILQKIKPKENIVTDLLKALLDNSRRADWRIRNGEFGRHSMVIKEEVTLRLHSDVKC